MANSRAKVNNETEGFVKILANAKTDKVLGVSIISELAGTMIAEIAIAMEFGSSAEDLGMTVFGHPTLSEVVHEAASSVEVAVQEFTPTLLATCPRSDGLLRDDGVKGGEGSGAGVAGKSDRVGPCTMYGVAKDIPVVSMIR